MITRAQAEALLTLAESLEACERLGVGMSHHHVGMVLGPDDNIECILPDSTSVQVRLAVNALIPKQPAAKKDCTKPGCFPYCDCGGIDDAPKRET